MQNNQDQIKQQQELAVSNFRQGLGYNCCQTVVHLYKPDEVSKYGTCGGGRAPDGMCGACYAVTQLRPDLEDIAKQEFIDKAKSYKCREIKGISKYPCQDCVRLAVKIMEEHK